MEWVIKDKYIGSVFFDASASAFILPSLMDRAATSTQAVSKDQITTSNNVCSSSGSKCSSEGKEPGGYGLGPEWVTKFGLLKAQNVDIDSYEKNGSLTVRLFNRSDLLYFLSDAL